MHPELIVPTLLRAAPLLIIGAGLIGWVLKPRRRRP